ncbi:conserved Plasmodium protein, unknown function [Plasmodium gallinaceum]|uniref:Uncharacterized protein n=1 Tax=Plasmodium gallinaceum TaxID=5849 RepID=A0A1J1GTR0_PLAGA|nr:conserved Plasmodium protein, unknown function [Plasmodium gallinaceum]CRG94694.1 conserved Plasmodium protein, unknown function [Plasmodium gallinaceum]
MDENLYDKFDASLHTNKNNDNEKNISYEDSNSTDYSICSELLNNCDKNKKRKISAFKNFKNDNDIKIGVKIALQLLLNNQPFPVKREDLFSTINIYVPNCNNNFKKKIILKLLKKQVNDILALKLLTLSSKTKNEYVLSQNILYEPHNDFLLSNLDHNIRGFLIFLIPFFKVFHNKIPLNYLLFELENVGHKTLKTKEEIIKNLTTPSLFTNIKNNILMNEIIEPLDYIIYAKKLSYIDFYNDQYDENSLDGFYCTPTIRYEYEINMKNYIKELLKIPNKKYHLKDMYALFEEKYFLDVNCDNL